MRTGRRLRIGEEFRAANEEDTSLEDDLGLPSRSVKSSGELLTSQVFELLVEVASLDFFYTVLLLSFFFVLLSFSMLSISSSLMFFSVFLEEYIKWVLICEKLIKYLEGQILMVDK